MKENKNIEKEKIEHKNIINFLKEQKIKYKSLNYYITALTHSTYVHESKETNISSYERMEFLGDAVLSMVVADFLFKKYLDYNEGDMTLVKHHFVKKEHLSHIGKSISIEKYMFLGKGTKKEGISDSTYENVIEALIGAIYLDIGITGVSKFINGPILSKIKDVKPEDLKDDKTKLQEWFQLENRKSISYNTSKTQDKNGNFYSEATFDSGIILGKGYGKTKSDAEQNAAKDANEKRGDNT